MVNVANRSDIKMRFISFKFYFCHSKILLKYFLKTFSFVHLEPTIGLEPMTSFLPRTCSTTELCGQPLWPLWWTGQDSNLRSPSERQIYSLVVLTTHPPVPVQLRFILFLPTSTKAKSSIHYVKPERGLEPTNLPITNRLRCHCATRAKLHFLFFKKREKS